MRCRVFSTLRQHKNERKKKKTSQDRRSRSQSIITLKKKEKDKKSLSRECKKLVELIGLTQRMPACNLSIFF